MTSAKNELSPVYELIGQALTDLGAHYEVLIFRFGEYVIHASCFTRIIHNRDILLTSADYQSWDKKDHTHNDLYLNIAKYGATLIGQPVRAVEVSPVHDLIIILDNDARIEIFTSEGNHRLSDDREQWFFYKPKDKTYPYLSVSSKSIERESEE